MSYMFEREYEPTADDGAGLEPAGHSSDTHYHDYLATYRSIGERASRRKILWLAAVVLGVVFAATLGVAAYLYVGV